MGWLIVWYVGCVIVEGTLDENHCKSLHIPFPLQYRKLRAYKERRIDGYHGGEHMGKAMDKDLDDLLRGIDDVDEAMAVEAAETVDPYAAEVTTIKSFNLNKPITMQEAIFALDYIDHDFYVYKDVDTDQISVVYKRNGGGIGLIQPEQ